LDLLKYVLILALGAFTHGVAFWSGQTASETLVLEALDKLSGLYAEVESNIYEACEFDGQLKGLYKDRFNQLTKLVSDKVSTPHTNPCRFAIFEFKKAKPPVMRSITLQTECDKWGSWSEFTSAEEGSYSFCIGEAQYNLSLSKETRREIFDNIKDSSSLSGRIEM